jgi:hypothetical protein
VKTLLVVLTTSAGLAMSAWAAENIPKGFVVPECTRSPDGRYGVTVPIFGEHEESEEPKNSVVEMATGKIIAVIDAKWTGWTRMAHGDVLPCRWSSDGSLLLWEVDGKWFRDAVVLLKFKEGKLEWQRDLTAIGQAESLKRTKRAAPDRYAKAKRDNAGNGAAYPEGFSIDVDVSDPIAFPLQVRATLTADPKATGFITILESTLTGLVDAAGKFVVKDFTLGTGL